MNLGQENEYQEFKESLGQLDKGLKSLVSMLNRHGGGTVFFGVDDNGEVVGLTVGKDTLMYIRNRIRDKIEPRIYAELSELKDENGKSYIVVNAKGSDIPYSFDGRYYIRNLSADEKASNELLRKMLSSSDSDLIRQKSSPKQDLILKTFFAVLTGCGIHVNDSQDFLYNYGLLNKEGKYNINAYLMADNNDISLKVVTFAGVDKSVMSTRTEYGKKCLLISMSEVLSYFESINVTDVNVDSSIRKEKSLFDFPSFKEAWINACLHNDWNNLVAPSIYLFDDRIEIVSYGGLPYSLSLDSFYSGTSVPVNKSLLTIFMATKYAEQSGHGIPTIVKKYGKEVFDFNDGMLKVTIPLSFERADVLNRKNKILNRKGLTENQRKVYEVLSNDGTLLQEDVAKLTSMSLAGVKKAYKKLQDYNLLERIGSKRDGTWLVK